MTAVVVPDEAELQRRVGLLSLEQKIQLLTGADFWALYAQPEVWLRRLVLSDGPAGVRGEFWDERDSSANVPCATALAATWDPGRPVGQHDPAQPGLRLGVQRPEVRAGQQPDLLLEREATDPVP